MQHAAHLGRTVHDFTPSRPSTMVPLQISMLHLRERRKSKRSTLREPAHCAGILPSRLMHHCDLWKRASNMLCVMEVDEEAVANQRSACLQHNTVPCGCHRV